MPKVHKSSVLVLLHAIQYLFSGGRHEAQFCCEGADRDRQEVDMDWSRNKETRGCLCVGLEAVWGLLEVPVLYLMSRGVQVDDTWTWRVMDAVQDIVDRAKLEEVARKPRVEWFFYLWWCEVKRKPNLLDVGFLYAHKPSAGLGNVQFVQRS